MWDFPAKLGPVVAVHCILGHFLHEALRGGGNGAGELEYKEAKYFAFMRGQDIQAKLVFHPTHHDMVHIISGMMDALGNVDKVMEVILRYASILKYSDALKAALKLICKWPRDLLEVLVSILVKYQNYQTADTDLKTLKKNNTKLMKGEKLIMPISVLKKWQNFPTMRSNFVEERRMPGLARLM